MVYNGVKFLPAAVEGKTEAEFIQHESHHGLATAQLKEVYSLMVPKPKKPRKASPVEDVPQEDHTAQEGGE